MTRRAKEEETHMARPQNKRHSKREGQHVPHEKRHRSTVMSGAYPQKVLSYLIEDGLQRKW